MAYVTPTTVLTNDLIAAGDWNKNTVDNPIALRTGEIALTSQAVGDLVIATSATQLGRVADVAVGQVLVSGGVTTAPAYSASPSITALTLATSLLVGNSTVNTAFTAGTITINGTSVGTTTTGSHNLFIPAQGIRPLPSSGAGSIEDATSTNNISGLPFDPTTSEGAYFWLKMPKSWNEGTITAKFVTFNKAGGSNNFVFSLAGLAASDDDSISTALGSAQQVTDGALTAYDVQISAATSAITLAGTPNAGDYCLFVVKRLPADAADTYASDVYLAGVELTITTDAENDN